MDQAIDSRSQKHLDLGAVAGAIKFMPGACARDGAWNLSCGSLALVDGGPHCRR